MEKEDNMEPAIPYPENQEAMAENIQESRVEAAELTRAKTNQSEAEPEYPTLKKLIPSAIALYLAFFLVALDRTIIATAIPTITDEFHSLNDVGWYGSVYMLTTCSFQLLMGRVYTFYNPKWVFLCAIGVFEIGSAICGAAPNSIVFIVGRAIAGAGSSGIFSGAIIIIISLVPLHQRPILQGLIGAVFGVSSVIGPLLGGVFTTKVSWRWCFYINLPVGGVAIIILILILKIPKAKKAGTPWRQQILQLDPIGTLFFVSGIVCLLLALQWGGSTYTWGNGRIIALLVLFVICISVFISVQIWKGETATVPPRIFTQRSIAAGMWSQFCVGSAMMTLVYYIPIWLQAIKNVNALKSGIDTLPLILSLVVSSICAGFLVTKIGYYTPFMIASSVIMSIGAGLITTWTPDTMHQKWIGYQFVFGFGLGMGMQQASLAAQAVLPRKDAPIGIALVMFCQQLGGAVFVSIGQSVFTNRLVNGLKSVAGISPAVVVNTGATDIRQVVDPSNLHGVIAAYNGALTKTYTVAVAMSCFSIIGALCIEWKNIKPPKKQAEVEKGEVDEKNDAIVDSEKSVDTYD
ncbi:MAG: hypothetical protein ASARMPREDX12_005450 [Alectoria sarmentosa]|nr:MAG: hypothetical protein ASARMPREDX12_005450 [Alectoria sarmentosa]